MKQAVRPTGQTHQQPVDGWILPLASPSQTMDARRERTRLFCFPNAGGGATSYRGWPAVLPDNVQLFAIQLPGREERIGEQPFTDIEPLLAELIPCLLPHLDGPFAFFGHSMGALICAEAARLLHTRYARTPSHLFVSGSNALHLVDDRSKRYLLSDQALIDYVRTLDGTPEELLGHPEMLRLLLRLLRADFSILSRYTYQPGPRLTCPITVLAGDADPLVNADGLRAWQDLTIGAVDIQIFSGGHFYLHAAQPDLLGLIAARLPPASAGSVQD